jgi:thiol-disulfide isomerase/thioredoxin
MKKIGLLAFTLLLFVIKTYAQAYKITGKLTGFKNNAKVELLDDNGNPINHSVLKQGYFDLIGSLKDGPQYLNLIIAEGESNYECTVFAGAGSTTIKGSKGQFPYNLTVSGSAEQTRYNAYQYSIKKFNLQREVLSKALSKVKERDTATNNKLVRQYNALSKNERGITNNAIITHPDAYYAAELMYEQRGDFNPDTVLHFYNTMPTAIKKSKYGKRLWLSINPAIKLNDSIYDFAATTQLGKTFKLSTLKGKYILLDFSSIYCGPCNESIDELRLISKKYADRLQVVTFSTDNKRDWLKGVKEDKVDWLSVSDGKGYYSETVLRYGVNGIPNFLLISPEGKVIDKWDAYGKPASGMGELESRIIAKLNKK